MGLLVWIMVAIALWHFTIFLPDRWWAGIVGAFAGAVLGSVIFGLIIHPGTIPGQDETDLLTAFESVPGALLGMAVVWFLGVRSEQRHATLRLRVTPPRFLAAISTPFAEDGSVALDAFGEHVAWLADAGPRRRLRRRHHRRGRAARGRRDRRADRARGRAGDGLRVIAQVGRPSTHATARLARRAIDLGADAVAAYVPWFYPATDADARTHFHGLLEAAGDVPAFLYNIPRRTVNDLSAELAGELAAAGFKGMKDSTGSFERHEAYLDATRDHDFELYIGSEPLVLRAYRKGAAGAITGLAGARPELFARLREALVAGDDAAADAVQEEIAAAKADVESEGSTAAVKRRVAAQLAAIPPRRARRSPRTASRAQGAPASRPASPRPRGPSG